MKHPVEPPGLVIGRGSEAELRIDDPGISRRHAQLKIHDSPTGSSVTISDLGSTNGVVLNGHRVQTGQVGDGSEIRLGNTTFVVRVSPPREDG
ncbi:MAG: FHA domain-containing protein [Aeromicrobium erythreum]